MRNHQNSCRAISQNRRKDSEVLNSTHFVLIPFITARQRKEVRYEPFGWARVNGNALLSPFGTVRLENGMRVVQGPIIRGPDLPVCMGLSGKRIKLVSQIMLPMKCAKQYCNFG